MRSPSSVSESSEPITKAPSAEEKPTALASVTIPKQRPMLTSSRISSERYCLTRFKTDGIT